jgi:N-acetylneuraminate synthase
VRRQNCPVGVFQCTTAYPCPPERLGLNVVGEIRNRYGCPVGLSDHSGTIYAALAAATLGVEMIEVHAVLSRESFGPDVPASVTMQELSQLVEGIRFIETAKKNPVDKEAIALGLSDLRRAFGKSIVAARDIPVGWCLGPEDLAIKKPAIGIAAARLPEVINRRTKRTVPANEMLSEDDLEPVQAS